MILHACETLTVATEKETGGNSDVTLDKNVTWTISGQKMNKEGLKGVAGEKMIKS